MNDANILDKPKSYSKIELKSKEIGFEMRSDMYVGSLLKTLITSKPKGRFLELGTGTGLGLSWMVDGMNMNAKLITVDNDAELVRIAKDFFDHDERLKFICQDAATYIKEYQGEKFDLVFADAWPGKYSEIEDILGLIEVGGFYIIDDMTEQSNWPSGHRKKVDGLVNYLEERNDFNLTKLNWSTGLLIAVRKY